MIVTNNAKGTRGIQAATGVAYLEPGESRDLDVSDADLVGLLANHELAVDVPKPKTKG